MLPDRPVLARVPLARPGLLVLLVSGALPAGPALADTDIDTTTEAVDASEATGASDATVAWQPFTRIETLDDGSVLTEYLVDTGAFDNQAVRLEASFSPRFDCDPMIGFVPDGALELLRDERTGLRVSIDGVQVDWPSPPDVQAALPRAGWLFADRQQRRTMRLRIDTGDMIALQRVDGPAIGFSLLGSRAGMAAAEAACRAHEPIPNDDV